MYKQESIPKRMSDSTISVEANDADKDFLVSPYLLFGGFILLLTGALTASEGLLWIHALFFGAVLVSLILGIREQLKISETKS